MKKVQITSEEYNEVLKASKKNTDKNVEKRLRVVILRYEGLSDKENATMAGYNRRRVSQLVSEFKKHGLEEYTRNKYAGNNRRLSREKEQKLLKRFEEDAKLGKITAAKDIINQLAKEPEFAGKPVHNSFVSRLLKRNKWRKLVPRPQHPEKASEEAVEASKKLSPN